MFLCITLHTIITELQATIALILIISTLNGYAALLYACMIVCTCKHNIDMDTSSRWLLHRSYMYTVLIIGIIC